MTAFTSPADGRTYVPVAWRDAKSMQSLFRRHGVTSIIEYDAPERTARLNVIGGRSARSDAALRDWDEISD